MVGLTSNSGMCNTITAGQTPKNSQYFVIVMGTVQNGAVQPPSGPGTYMVQSVGMMSATNIATVTFDSLDATCTSVSAKAAEGVSGTVTLTSVNNGAYSGSFDIMLNSSDHVTGSFTASACAGLSALISSQKPMTCI
jgi:hypothetical protein